MIELKNPTYTKFPEVQTTYYWQSRRAGVKNLVNDDANIKCYTDKYQSKNQ